MKQLELTYFDLMFFPTLAEKGNLLVHKTPLKEFKFLNNLFYSPTKSSHNKVS